MEFPRLLRDGGYFTASFGKDHFGWNTTSNSGISHGYINTSVRSWMDGDELYVDTL